MNPKTIGIGAGALAVAGIAAGIILSSSGSPTVPPAPPMVWPTASGIHARVMNQCKEAPGLVCDFIDDTGAQVVLVGLADGGFRRLSR